MNFLASTIYKYCEPSLADIGYPGLDAIPPAKIDVHFR